MVRKVVERRVDVMAVAYQSHHRDLEELGQLSQGIGQHRGGTAEGISRLGIYSGDVACVNDSFKLSYEQYVVGELALADAADESQQPFSLKESVDSDHVVHAVGESGPRGHLEVHECVVVAQQQIRRLYALHADLCEMVPVLDEIRRAQSPDERPEVHPHGLPGHIETLDVVQHTAVLRREFSIII